jgi:NAD(P)-dependent dehydrogenase (short-subunit alcohol dehydrogenase family)
VKTELLHNKTIMVMGGTSGLGLSAAKAIIAAGGNIVAVGLNQESINTARNALGTDSIILAGDASVSDTAENAIQAAIENWGRLDGLYHVAGGSGRRAGDGPLHEVTDEGWDFTIQLNLTSQFYSNRAAVRQFLKQGDGGVVLNMGSVLGWSPSPKYFSTYTYAAAKSAIIGMTKAAASFYAAANIRFNVIAPGLVETPMAQRAVADEQIMSFIKHKQPLDHGRIGQPDDLDGAVVYLLSDQAKFVTGQVLAIDGGWSVTEGQYPE